MNYKNATAMTMLSVAAMFVIISFAGYEINDTDAQTVAVQPEKFVFVEKISTTALFEFRDGTELVPVQQFTQTSGFATKSSHSKQTPTFTLEKIVGGTPYLYEAADQALRYDPGMEYPYKFSDVTIILAANGDTLRSFQYSDCIVTNYVVTTRSDNEEGYTGKGFVLVDQFTFECRGYEPLNPSMDKMRIVDHAQTISSSDLRSTDSWGPGFSISK